MTLATFAIIFSAVALASSVSTLVYASRIRSLIASVESNLHTHLVATAGTILSTEKNITAVLSDLGLEKKPELNITASEPHGLNVGDTIVLPKPEQQK